MGWVPAYKDTGEFPNSEGYLTVRICICEPTYRGRGCETLALKRFIRYFREQGEKLLYIQTWFGNAAMIALVRKLGFREVKQIKDLREGKTYQRLKGDFLGQGGAGTVFLVKREETLYAAKKVELHNEDKPGKTGEENRKKNDRFREEIQFCKQFHSVHVIQIVAAEEDKDKEYIYYIMPYYENTLRNWIREGVTLEKKFDFLDQLYEAVSTIHDNGVIHRDIKPENILINSEGLLVLADFGISHFEGSERTMTKELLANRVYFAPEQIKGKDQKAVGFAADVFALGLITNELFTLSIPQGSTFTRIGDVYPLLSDLDDLVERMTYQDPDSRISIASAKSELKRIMCSYSESLDDVGDYLRYSQCTQDWESKLDEIKWGRLHREIAEAVLKMRQQKIDNLAPSNLLPSGDDQILSSVESIEQELNQLQYLVEEDCETYSCEKILQQPSEDVLQSIENEIYAQAAEEVLLANQLLKKLSAEEWESYNKNYHHNIRFSPDENLLHAAQSVCFLEACRKKFDYEANAYRSVSGTNRQSTYDSSPTEEQKGQLDTWLAKRHFSLEPIAGYKRIHGMIRKYFISCCSNHCTELLETMESKSINQPWNGFSSEESAICLAHDIAVHLAVVANPDEDARNRLGEFDLSEHIDLADVIDWPLEEFLKKNEYARNLKNGSSLDENVARGILESLKEQYSGVNFEIRDSRAIVNFTDSGQYDCFCHKAREKAKGHYVFEGDVIDILVPSFSGDGLTQHIWDLGFDVKHTLAMVLGLLEIE